jgi:RimJ/RimL family protein N-acetyltransferase
MIRLPIMFQEIETGRLILRDLGPADAEVVTHYRADPEVSRYQSWEPDSVQKLRSYIAELAARDPGTPGAWYQIGIALRSGGELVGDCGIRILNHARQAEIGITVAPAFQRRAYASEALRAMLDYVFVKLRKHRISASVDPRNAASIRLMQSLGFRQEAHLIESLWFKGQWVDDIIFAMLAKEWTPAEASLTPAAARHSDPDARRATPEHTRPTPPHPTTRPPPAPQTAN